MVLSELEKNAKDDADGPLKGFRPSSVLTDYLKKFFYQILGIYFPAVILLLYIFLFWFVGIGNDPIRYYGYDRNFNNIDFHDGWPGSLTNNTHILSNMKISDNVGTVSVILTVFAIVIIGEAMNAITSRISILSPTRYNYLRRISRSVQWPLWSSESFNVSFSQFDRYYISAVEQDKRVLAGKIGWISFYRNMAAVFVTIFISQIVLTVSQIALTGLPKIHGYEIYVLSISGIGAILFYLGYRAQIKSNGSTLWDAYSRFN